MGYSIVNGRIVRSGVWKITGGDAMAYRKDRPRPTAYLATGGVQTQPVVLSTGRGDTKLTPTEARELAAELVASADKADKASAHVTPYSI